MQAASQSAFRRGTNAPLPFLGPAPSLSPMLKRTFAGVSWTLASWIVFSWVVSLAGLPNAIAVVAAVPVGLFIAMDPMHRIWLSPSNPAQAGTALVTADQI